MRILFIYPVPPDTRNDYTGYHHGIGILSAVMKRAGHRTALLTADSPDTDVIDDAVRIFRPELAAFSVTSRQFPLACLIGSYLYSKHGVPSVYGGAHATVMPDQILAEEGVAAVCMGEGERALPALAAALEAGTDAGSIPNLVTAAGNAGRGLYPPADLDGLPDCDREIFSFQEHLDRYGSIMGAEFLGSRGCPYHCTYCVNHIYNKKYRGAYYRRRSVGSLLAEITAVRQRYRFGLAGFHDDIFTFDRAWLEEFAARYPREVGLPFWCNTWADCVDAAGMKLLRKAGCRRIHIGVETGSTVLRKNILKRDLADDQIITSFALARMHGIKTLSFNMIGLPDETEDDIRATVALNRRLRPDRVQVTVFNAYPGTEAFDLCREKGLLPEKQDGETWFDPGGALIQPQLSRETVAGYLERFVSLVYG